MSDPNEITSKQTKITLLELLIVFLLIIASWLLHDYASETAGKTLGGIVSIYVFVRTYIYTKEYYK